MIKYEDLVSKPQDKISKICHKLELDFNQEMLNTTHFRDNTGKRWSSNSSWHSHSGISTNSIAQWKSVLSDEEVTIIENYCKDEMNELGYELTMPEFKKNRRNTYTENTDNFRPWMKQYNFKSYLDDFCK